jgi:galactokinase
LLERIFETRFGRAPEVMASAPGRVNLIGEHTDYNGGFVLPMAIPQKTRVALARRDDGAVVCSSVQMGDGAEAIRLGAEVRSETWTDFVAGVTQALARAGQTIAGFDVAVDSEVPIGGGLSSSASLEVALLRGLRQLYQLAIDDIAIARLGQRAENDLVGAPVGIMDQMAASLAGDGTALFLDTRSLGFERVAVPAGAEVLVIDSGIHHRHSSGEYRIRRGECVRAAELLGVPELRDVAGSDLGRLAALPPTLRRRARHVVTENARVLEAVAALRAGDIAEMGALMDASHVSMRDDFDISLPEIDRLVELARAAPLIAGARLTGGGFGGSIVALGQAGAVAAFPQIAAAYEQATGQRATLLVPKADLPSAGV